MDSMVHAQAIGKSDYVTSTTLLMTVFLIKDQSFT